jgi:hypothetical protein
VPSLDSLLAQPITKGSFNATSGATSLGSATTAGHTLLVFATTYGSTGISTPSGYTLDTPTPVTTQKVYAFRKSNIGASETLPTLATGASTQKTIWFALELAGLDLSAPKDVNSAIAAATAQSISTAGVTGTGYETVVFALFLAQNASGTTPPTWSGYTGAYAPLTEQAEQGQADATTSIGAALVSLAPHNKVQLEALTATSSLAANGPLAAVAVKYLVAESKTAADYRMILGFEWGTSAGLITGMSGSRLLETTTGTVAVTSSTPRTGGYCLEIGSGTSAVHNATASFTSSTRLSVFYPFRFATLPATDTEIFAVTPSGGVDCVVRFIAATSKIGVKVGTGTEQVSAETISAGSYQSVDLDYDMVAGTASWQLNSVDQAQASGSATGIGSGALRLGWSIASAAVMRVDDVIVAGRKGNWPLNDHRVVLVGVDPAGTVSVEGTAANFRRYTANGTIDGTWNATDVRNALDELPPTVGASNDGVVQVTNDALSYVRVPLATYTAAANEVIRAVRMLFMGWAASATAAHIGFWAYSGSESGFGAELLLETTDPGFDNSTTAPAWFCEMFTPSGGWTQDKLDALEARGGGSDDAAPDVGWGWCGAEAAILQGRVDPVFGHLDDDLHVEAPTDPLTGGIIALHAYAPADQGDWTLVYEVDGVEQTPVSVPAGSNPVEVVLRAADMPTISRITLRPA